MNVQEILALQTEVDQLTKQLDSVTVKLKDLLQPIRLRIAEHNRHVHDYFRERISTSKLRTMGFVGPLDTRELYISETKNTITYQFYQGPDWDDPYFVTIPLDAFTGTEEQLAAYTTKKIAELEALYPAKPLPTKEQQERALLAELKAKYES